VSGWKMLLDKVDPRVSNRQSLGIARVLMRLTEMGGKHDNDRGDITIRPAVDPFSLADFKAFDRLVALGYEAGVRSLGEWSDSPAARALLGR
jgi:hypothetical protein